MTTPWSAFASCRTPAGQRTSTSSSANNEFSTVRPLVTKPLPGLSYAWAILWHFHNKSAMPCVKGSQLDSGRLFRVPGLSKEAGSHSRGHDVRLLRPSGMARNTFS
jgi:hypothetical protein